MYYLQSRYYDATVGRFVNADDVEVTTHSNKQQNSFTYCANNGIVAYDTLGYFPVHLVVGTVAGFIWGIAPRLLKMILFKQRAKLSDVLCDGLAGAVGGFITAATGNSTLGTFWGTFVGEVVRYFVQERPFSSGTSFLTILINIFICLIMAGIAALASFIAGKLVNKITKKKFSSKQIKQYLKQTKKLKSALGIGTNGKTARRMWYMDCGITTALANGLNTVVEFIKEFLKKVMS